MQGNAYFFIMCYLLIFLYSLYFLPCILGCAVWKSGTCGIFLP